MGVYAPQIVRNSSAFVRPPGFYVIGFTNFKFAELYLFFLGFIYILTLLCNSFIIYIILIDRRLHTPKYIAVANLGVIDIMSCSSFIPSSIHTFVTKETFMSYNACLTQMFFFYTFLSLESFSLSVLSYDRLIAICFPLRHNTINTPRSMTFILAIIWLFCVSIDMFMVASSTELSYCDKVTVNNFFCEHIAVFRLACNDNRLQWSTASSLSILILFGPLIFIVMSYACILRAVFGMKSIENRYKALATCSGHLLLVAIFYMPNIAVYMIELFAYEVETDVEMLGLSLGSCIPSCLNPIVYSLATKEIKSKIVAMLQKVRVSAGAGQRLQ